MEKPGLDRPSSRIVQASLSMDVEEKVLDEVFRLRVVSEDAPAYAMNQACVAAEEDRQCLTVASTDLPNERVIRNLCCS
jgi:hypothetical protein